ncbi:MAG: prolyl oligopeptidase family serine peptidase [Kofleriaceae bacterium]|jgi:protease II|nr:prolyl oligopeptidase family serine peptidase [Kofleriaceae bacterium]MBP9168136.1 prolyl oligopeptidase family serine peptidase [Kofleriaceae bacterium]MBP9856486.1 prolyl oligopeptidase family serine peptidase [Kofleriaceae bacterium]
MISLRFAWVAALAACARPTPPAAPACPPVTATAPTPDDDAPPPPPPADAASPTAPGYTGLGADSVTPEIIARFAAAPLPPEVSRRIQAMLDVRAAGTGYLTRDGKRMYATSAITGTAQVWRQDGPLAFPVQLTGGEDRTTVVGLSPDDRFLVVARDVGGEENPGLYLQDADGGALRVILHQPKVQASLQYITDDSRALYYTANDVDPGSYAIYRFDVATGARTRVFDTPGLWRITDRRATGAGDEWLLTKALGNTHQEIYRYAVATKTLTPVVGQGQTEQYDVAFGPRPGELFVRTNQPSDYQRIYRRTADGALVPVTPELRHDITGMVIDEARTRLYYVVNQDGFLRLHALDARTLKPLALPTLAGDNQRFASVSRDGRYVQLTVDGARLPPTSVVWDWKTRRATTWRLPMTPEIDVGSFAPVALETYPARDGTPIPMLVRRPAACATAATPCPVVVDFHGGPESQSLAGFDASAQLFVDAGFVFVEPNVRGSSGYGKAWLHADDGARRKDVVTDIEDAARYIRTAWAKGGVAPRIGVMGGSYGGYATLMAMTYFAGAYDAGVATVGISNLVTFIQNTAPYRRILRMSEYGDPAQLGDVMRELSPTTHVDKLVAPLLVIQGVNDPRVPVGEALQFYRAMEARQVPGGLILFADEGHGTSKRGNQVLARGHTLAFFERHLK